MKKMKSLTAGTPSLLTSARITMKKSASEMTRNMNWL